MQTSDLQREDFKTDRWQLNLRIALAALVWTSTLGIACAAGTVGWASSSMRISAADQAARDSERVEILRAELRKSHLLLASLSQGHADRPSTPADASIEDAKAERTRVLGDIAALDRELAIADDATPMRRRVPPFAPTGRVNPTAATKPPEAVVVRWWDVYSRADRQAFVHVDAKAPASATPAVNATAQRREEQ